VGAGVVTPAQRAFLKYLANLARPTQPALADGVLALLADLDAAECERDALAQRVAKLEAGVRRMAVGGGCQWHGCYRGQGIDPTTGDREDVEHSDVCPIYFTNQARALLAGPAKKEP
jgi:hypothetical protein